MLSVIVLSVTMLRAIILCVILQSHYAVPSVILLGVIMPKIVRTSDVAPT